MLRALQIVRAVADAAERWRDADFPLRLRTTQAIVQRTGYTEPVVDYALDALFGSIDRSALVATIAGELGSVDALDGFVARRGRPDVFYRPIGNVVILSSETTIGVAIPAFAFALCSKSHVMVKDRDDGLTAAFGETLASELPELRAAIRVERWSGSSDASDEKLGDVDAVVAYGRTETLSAIRAQLGPEVRFIPFGHRTSIGYVTREVLSDVGVAEDCASGIARDALLYDGDGCLSLHAVFVERGAILDPAAFAAIAAASFAAAAIEFPAANREPGPDASAYMRTARFRDSQGQAKTFGGSPAGSHLIVLDPPRDEPPPLVHRTVAFYSVDGPEEALAFVRRHALPLEAVGVYGRARSDVEAFAIASGAARLATLGTLQRPPLGGEHGATGRILPFVRPIYR
jgi:hypothetical protein